MELSDHAPIDDNEVQHNLRSMLIDDVCGEEGNFVSMYVWEKKFSHPNGLRTVISPIIHEYAWFVYLAAKQGQDPVSTATDRMSPRWNWSQLRNWNHDDHPNPATDPRGHLLLCRRSTETMSTITDFGCTYAVTCPSPESDTRLSDPVTLEGLRSNLWFRSGTKMASMLVWRRSTAIRNMPRNESAFYRTATRSAAYSLTLWRHCTDCMVINASGSKTSY